MGFRLRLEFSGLCVIHLDQVTEADDRGVAKSATAYLAPYAGHRARMYLPTGAIQNQSELATSYSPLGWKTVSVPGGRYLTEVKLKGHTLGDAGGEVRYRIGDKVKVEKAAIPVGKEFWRPINHALDLEDFFGVPKWAMAVSKFVLPPGRLFAARPDEEPDRHKIYSVEHPKHRRKIKRVLADRLSLDVQSSDDTFAIPFDPKDPHAKIVVVPLLHDPSRPVVISISCHCCLAKGEGDGTEDVTGFGVLFDKLVSAATIRADDDSVTYSRPICPAGFFRTRAAATRKTGKTD